MAVKQMLVDFDKAAWDKVILLMKEANLTDPQELFNAAYTMLSWAVRETRSGRMIGSTDAQGRRFRLLSLSVLDDIRP